MITPTLSSAGEPAAVIGAFVDRVNALLTRLVQCNVSALNERLKRQHLLDGADVGHVSRSTISGIMGEIERLRGDFGAIMGEGRLISKKEWKLLMGVVRSLFRELGELRMKVNEGELEKIQQHQQHGQGGWISKFFGSAGEDHAKDRRVGMTPLRSSSPLPIGKLGPALGASTTTVNVEFSGVGVRGHATKDNSNQQSPSQGLGASTSTSSPGIKGIFAGSRNQSEESWLVIPKTTPQVIPQPIPSHHEESSRRTLRRGLSDSSIRTTAASQGLLAMFSPPREVPSTRGRFIT